MLYVKNLFEKLIGDLRFIVYKCEELEEECVIYGELPESRKIRLVGIENLYISYNQDYTNIITFLAKEQNTESKHKILNTIRRVFSLKAKTEKALSIMCKKELDLINKKLEYIKYKSNLL